MTEPIIINGVDVSGCSYAILPKQQCPMKSMPYAKETSCTACKENNTKLNFCKNNSNCYYKQLKRTQQELQQAMDNYVKATNYYEDKLAQIKRIINEVENESK